MNNPEPGTEGEELSPQTPDEAAADSISEAVTEVTEEPEAEDAPVTMASDYITDRKFSDFPLSNEVLEGIAALEYDQATPVQATSIEPALAGRDLLVRAKTGTGKTAAFCIPIVERIDTESEGVRAIILTPTRELASQIAEVCEVLAEPKGLGIALLMGGMPYPPQLRALETCSIVIGTPGRIIDHIERGNLDLSNIEIACLDEADEMLSLGFFEDVTKILDKSPEGRQVLLFSATITHETEQLIGHYLNDPEKIQLSTDADQVHAIEHVMYEMDMKFHKVRFLLYLLDIENPTSAIIFCNTREDTNTVATFLDRQGLDVQLISGELSQPRRAAAMQKVKKGQVRFLVATDVAARGIDISHLTHVINYSLPQDPKIYLHRTGRTGRIGKEGIAISLAGALDIGTRHTLVHHHKIKFSMRELPSQEECLARRAEHHITKLREAMQTMVFEGFLPTVKAIQALEEGDNLLAAALSSFFAKPKPKRADEDESSENKRSSRGRSGGRGEGRNRGEREGGGGRSEGRGRNSGGRGEKRNAGRDNRGGRGRGDERGGRGRGDERGGRGRGDDRGGRGRSDSKPQSPRNTHQQLDDLDSLLSIDD